jgi:hypothetical protein
MSKVGSRLKPFASWPLGGARLLAAAPTAAARSLSES